MLRGYRLLIEDHNAGWVRRWHVHLARCCSVLPDKIDIPHYSFSGIHAELGSLNWLYVRCCGHQMLLYRHIRDLIPRYCPYPTKVQNDRYTEGRQINLAFHGALEGEEECAEPARGDFLSRSSVVLEKPSQAWVVVALSRVERAPLNRHQVSLSPLGESFLLRDLREGSLLPVPPRFVADPEGVEEGPVV